MCCEWGVGGCNCACMCAMLPEVAALHVCYLGLEIAQPSDGGCNDSLTLPFHLVHGL